MAQEPSLSQLVGATAMVSGTAIGAGMLAIPSLTTYAGFYPSLLTSFACWLLMSCTGLLLVEACLWEKDSEVCHFHSIAERFLGYPGKILITLLFLFFYYCLMIAYFSGLSPYFHDLVHLFGFNLSLWQSILAVCFISTFLLSLRTAIIDKVNLTLTVGLVLSFIALIRGGFAGVDAEKLSYSNWSHILTAAPIMLGAFGYHNVVPTVSKYLGFHIKSTRLVIFIGSFLPFVFYTIWQWIVLGNVAHEQIVGAANAHGVPIVEMMKSPDGNLETWHWLIYAFCFFAIITSFIGVGFSIVDFLGDNLRKYKPNSFILSILTLLPPALIVCAKPDIFLKAFGVASGIGGTMLNGFFPIIVVAIGVYRHKLKTRSPLLSNPFVLGLMVLLALLVIAAELNIFSTAPKF